MMMFGSDKYLAKFFRPQGASLISPDQSTLHMLGMGTTLEACLHWALWSWNMGFHTTLCPGCSL